MNQGLFACSIILLPLLSEIATQQGDYTFFNLLIFKCTKFNSSFEIGILLERDPFCCLSDVSETLFFPII